MPCRHSPKVDPLFHVRPAASSNPPTPRNSPATRQPTGDAGGRPAVSSLDAAARRLISVSKQAGGSKPVMTATPAAAAGPAEAAGVRGAAAASSSSRRGTSTPAGAAAGGRGWPQQQAQAGGSRPASAALASSSRRVQGGGGGGGGVSRSSRRVTSAESLYCQRLASAGSSRSTVAPGVRRTDRVARFQELQQQWQADR